MMLILIKLIKNYMKNINIKNHHIINKLHKFKLVHMMINI